MPRLPSLAEDAVVADLFAAFPDHRGPLFAMMESVMRGPGEWDIAEREFIAAYVSALNACSYCTGAHVIYAEAFGIPQGLLARALDDLDAAELTGPMRETLRYLGKVNRLPHKLRQADMDAVLAVTDEAALVEALTVAGLYNMMNRLLEGTGVTFDLRSDPSRHGIAAVNGDPRSHHYAATKPAASQ